MAWRIFGGWIAASVQLNPDWGVIRWLFHAADQVIDAAIFRAFQYRFRTKQKIDAQAALWLIFKPAGSIVEPAEKVA